MEEKVYQQLCETMKNRGGMYPGMDIPEFYEMAKVLFSDQEAAIAVLMPRGFHTADEIAREIAKDVPWTARHLEGMEILARAETAGLVHCTNNRQEIDFLCNCCSCHCVILKNAAMHPKPGLAVNSGFQPVLNPGVCESCEICVERCTMDAIRMNDDNLPVMDLDFCIGCGLCASGCPVEAIVMTTRDGIPTPPVNNKALKKAIQAGAHP
jgi:Pyruvate/2-oxoacid:ferredoxin oxidoreductase delta subunit